MAPDESCWESRRGSPLSQLARRLSFEAMALHFLAEAALDDLLTAWRHYDDVRSVDQPVVADLGPARIQLDQARARMHRLRSVLYPNTDEKQAVLVTALCSVLDEVVHLNASHRVMGRSNDFTCVCGEVVSVSPVASQSVSGLA